MTDSGWTRRAFVRASVAAGGGLLVAVAIPGCRRPDDLLAGPPGPGTDLTMYVRLHLDGRVTIFAPKIEMGQGSRTSLPMIVAEELDVDWDQVHVEAAPLDEERYGWQGAGGSTSVWQSWDRLRKGGAAVRAMVREAAAGVWGVPVHEVETDRGTVRHQGTARSAAYAEFAEAAAALPVPEDPPLKDPASFRIIGRPTSQVHVAALVTGRERFAWDTRVPDMLRIAVARGRLGATPMTVDEDAARAVPGVRDVIRLDASAHRTLTWHGVAVVADSTWAAFRGRDALAVEWTGGDPEGDSERLRRALVDSLQRPGRVLTRAGDFTRGIAGAVTTLDAVYELPLLAHAPMEPNAVFAHVRDDGVTIRGPFQDPIDIRSAAAELTGLLPERILVEPCRLGGGFGRRLGVDYGTEAVVLARQVGAPVQVVWSREDDIRRDEFRQMAAHRLTAGLDAHGRIVAWRQRKASTSIMLWRRPATDRPEHYELYRDDLPAHLVPDYQLEYVPFATPVALGTWRSVVHSGNAFAMQGFLDELAHAAGKDPLAFQVELLGESRELPYEQHGGPGWNPGRLRGVLELAAARAGWGTPLPAGRGRGIAAHFTFGTYVGMVAEVSVDASGRITVHRIVSAVDCGMPVNPRGIEAQMQGGILYGLSAALTGEITVRNGEVVQGNFDTYPVLRMPDAPDIDVHIVPSTEAPKGVGEPRTPPVLPAVANAVFAATGVRHRRAPLMR